MIGTVNHDEYNLTFDFFCISVCLSRSDTGPRATRRFNLSTLLNPETLFSAMRVQHAREMKCSMNDLKMVCSWKGSQNEDDSSGSKMIIEGLLIQGAVLRGDKLVDCAAYGEELSPLPPVSIMFEPLDGEHRPDTYAQSTLEVPLYYNLSREKLLGTLTLPCSQQDRVKWILASVAIFIES